MFHILRSCHPEEFWKCLRPTTLLKKRLWHRCFPVNFVKVLRIPLLAASIYSKEKLSNTNQYLPCLFQNIRIYYGILPISQTESGDLITDKNIVKKIPFMFHYQIQYSLWENKQ